jgi:hypothetical protein
LVTAAASGTLTGGGCEAEGSRVGTFGRPRPLCERAPAGNSAITRKIVVKSEKVNLDRCTASAPY